MKIGHQGDILIIQVTDDSVAFSGNLPEITERNTYVLHHGEALGNNHELAVQDGVDVFDQGFLDAAQTVKQMVVKAQKAFKVFHVNATATTKEDALHKHLEFPAGTYIVRTQQETMRGVSRRLMD